MTEVMINSEQDVVVARRIRRMITIVVALAAAMAEWFLAAKLLDNELVVNQGGGIGPVRPLLVGVAPVASGLLGWSLLAIFERLRLRRPALVWRIVAGVVLVLSLWSPLTMATTITTALWLASMHVVVGGILIAGLPTPPTPADRPAPVTAR